MAILKHTINFLLEKRINKKTGELITKNVPINMKVHYAGNQFLFYTGYRIDPEKWSDKTNEGEKVQRMKKNTFTNDNVSASIVNARLATLESIVNNIFIHNYNELPTNDKIKQLIREGLNENSKPNKAEGLWEHFEKYIQDAKVTEGRRNHLKSTRNHFKAFEESRGFKINYSKCTTQLIAQFEKYLGETPEPNEEGKTPRPRSKNTISGNLSRVKAFFSYAVKQGWVKTSPFDEFKIESQVYGDPIYLTKQERDQLFYAEIKNDRLARIRDMFVLQCFLGCRVGDFMELTKANIINGFIHYIPEKGKDESQKVVKVPLSEKALTIIKKYNMPDRLLFPPISDQKYNEYIKELFELMELNRPVVRLNPVTRQNEIVPLYQVASSHMARRTFIGLLHKTVKNEVIASMSGHVENSKAFSRYYKIDEESQKDAIKTIE
jgi:integrase